MTLPAFVVAEPSYAELPQVVIDPATARAHGWSVDPTSGLISTTRLPTQAEVDRVNRQLGQGAGIYVERGYHAHYGIALLMLAAAAALITFAGTSVSVALSMAESRADQATLAAVGASPSRRRRQAIAQAAVIAGVGAILGLALGALVGVGLLAGSSSYPLTLPVRWLAIVFVSAPVIATIPAALFAGGKLRLTRRIA
jgi:putative ABC transport system permease protein